MAEVDDIVWVVHYKRREVLRAIVMEEINEYFYTYIEVDGRTTLYTVHRDNVFYNEERAKKQLFVHKLSKEDLEK